MKNKNNLVTIGDRIWFARESLSEKIGAKITQAKLAEMCGWGRSQTRVGNYEQDKREPGFADLSKIAEKTGVRVEWLLSGKGHPFDVLLSNVRNIRETANVEYLPTRPKQAKETLDVEVLDVAGSMGLGQPQPDGDTVVGHMRLSVHWINNNLSISRPENLAVITGYGDSMSPTYHDGDILLVDRGVTRLNMDAVYVMSFKSELYIKRIQRRPNGTYRMISDNPHYDAYDFTETDLPELQVLGRVLWAWNGRKL